MWNFSIAKFLEILIVNKVIPSELRPENIQNYKFDVPFQVRSVCRCKRMFFTEMCLKIVLERFGKFLENFQLLT